MLTVSEPLRPEMARAARQQIDTLMKERITSIEQRASEHGVSVDLEQEIDVSPAAAIVRFAKLKGCDLIVMASHGRRGLRRLVLGSQANEVLAYSKVPTMIVR